MIGRFIVQSKLPDAMKRLIILCISLLFMTKAAKATGQEGDIIFIDGERWELLGRPIVVNSALYQNLKAALPEDRVKTTANWDGYKAFWSIDHNKLCLDSIQYYDAVGKGYVGRSIPVDTLLSVFNSYIEGNCIGASWLTKEIRVASGKRIYYEHLGFVRNYENEMLLNIDHGKIADRKVYHNYSNGGLSFDYFVGKVSEKFPIDIEHYPELANASRILFRIKSAKVDIEGKMVDGEVEATVYGDGKKEKHPALAAEMTAALKAYRPWRVLFINGEYCTKGIEGFSFPYIIAK